MSDQKSCPERLPAYGGQALIEGVLMRGAKAVAVAMRAPDGNIVVQTEPLTGIYTSRWIKVPFIRGLVALWDALGLGMRYLAVSANLQTNDDEKIEGKTLALTLGVSILFALGLFFALPALLGWVAEHFLGLDAWSSNLVEGLLRLAIVIGYIWGIGRMPEIQRVFAYHGAEHKTINAYENRLDMTVENIMPQTVEHPRCGTAFLLTLVLLSVLVFTIIGPLPPVTRILSRILFVPVLAMIAYEYIRWTARHLDSPFVKVLIKPNLALQRLTTNEPDAQIVEVALTAFQAMLEKERAYAVETAQAIAAEVHPSPSATD